MENFSRRIWLVGGSVRAAAASAQRAGWSAVCSDFFADADLRQMADIETVNRYPAGLLQVAERLPRGPWLYTGGLENHPELVAAISERHSLWGNGAAVLGLARDPFFLAETLGRAGLPALEVRTEQLTNGGVWLQKPRHGSGGCGISVAGTTVTGPAGSHYFQKFVSGESISGLFLAWPGGTQLLEITGQLHGLPEVHAPAFAWCGNIAPYPVAAETRETITAIGNTLAEACSLRGLFGCDFILRDGVPWLTEINPRYTGSVELVEILRRMPLLEWHRRACHQQMDGADLMDHMNAVERRAGSARAGDRSFVGKVILYNATDGMAPGGTRFVRASGGDPWRLPLMADIPVAGTHLIAGQPLCTVYATASSVAACRAKLLRRARRVYNRLRLKESPSLTSHASEHSR